MHVFINRLYTDPDTHTHTANHPNFLLSIYIVSTLAALCIVGKKRKKSHNRGKNWTPFWDRIFNSCVSPHFMCCLWWRRRTAFFTFSHFYSIFPRTLSLLVCLSVCNFFLSRSSRQKKKLFKIRYEKMVYRLAHRHVCLSFISSPSIWIFCVCVLPFFPQTVAHLVFANNLHTVELNDMPIHLKMCYGFVVRVEVSTTYIIFSSATVDLSFGIFLFYRWPFFYKLYRIEWLILKKGG